jgi:transcriptional regulator with XRE-family HTH domain
MDLRLTQQTLADQLGCWLQTVSKWERDLSEPLAPHWGAIEAFLGPGLVPQREGLGGRIRTARLRLGLTQEELGRRAGAHLRSVWNAEKGIYGPSKAMLERLKAVLGDVQE